MTLTTPFITHEKQEGVLVITLNRPEKKNALTQAMYTALSDALLAGEADESIRVLFITGQETEFTAGNDIVDFLHNPPTDASSPVIRFLKTLVGLEKPLVAAVNGNAVGIGTTLLLHCDLVYLGEHAKLQLPFVNLALCAEGASSLLLPQRVGYVKAAELLLLGKPFTAETALALGLANAIFPQASYQQQALAQAQQLAKQPPQAVRLTKMLLKGHQLEAVHKTVLDEAALFFQCMMSAEAREAFAAFIEKRAPVFSGK